MFDFSKLVGLIIEKFGTRAACAKAAGMSEASLYRRLKGETPFTVDDVYALCSPECLNLSAEEVPAYFFTLKVR